MTQALEQLEGVLEVQADVIPDHLLIDHDGSRRTGEEFASVLNGLPSIHGRCRAAVMQSCITATGRSLALHSLAER
jgi:copper chaperone CopZ